MRRNTFVMLLIALVFGGVAVFMANIWLNSQAPRQSAALPPAPAVVETSTLVVAARDLAFGEVLIPDALREIPWPRSAIPDGSFAKISDVTGEGPRVVLNSISPNEPVLKWKISGSGARASLSAIVERGMRAVAVRLNDVVGVGGFILPGDRVDVLYTRNGSEGASTTDVIIQNVRVLAVDQVADQKQSTPIVAKVATIEVTTIDAQKVALAQTTGQLSLTLRAAGSLDNAAAQRVVEAELVSSPSIYQNEFDARAAAQAALDARLKGLEGTITTVSKKVDETNLKRAELAAQIEALQEEIRKAGEETAEGAALRARLAELEASMKGLSNRPVIVAPAAEVVIEEKSSLISVGVTRGVKRETYEVPPYAAE